jgi:DNA-binding CsgD family transcriptional regulator
VQVVTATTTRRRVRHDLVRLVERDLALPDFTRQATALVRRAVPGEGTCLVVLDPATLLPTHEIVDNGLPVAATARMAEIELLEPDVNKFAVLARGSSRAASLSAATDGDLDRSARQREVRRPNGFGDELRAMLADDTGTWGALTVLRELSSPAFTAAEVRFVASVAGVLAEGVRRALVSAGTAGPAPGEAGVVILAPDGSLELADRAGDHWLGQLEPDRGEALPPVVPAVARRARHGGDGGPAFARVRTSAGDWLTVRASLLGDGLDAPVAVRLEPTRPPELAPLLVAAFGLTERERTITELVARGYATNAIATRLGVTPYTVQDHLKSIFEKSGTGSRAELVARLFVEHPDVALPNAGRP